jgi:flagellar biosynthesis protein FlhF
MKEFDLMQVKKFEAPTIQEALDTIKRELGPDAIILQTKNHKRGFGLMSKASVEVTAAVSERSLQKKQYVEQRFSDETREAVKKLPASRQAEFFDRASNDKARPARAAASAPLGRAVASALSKPAATAPAPRPASLAQAYQTASQPAPARSGAAPVDQLLGGKDVYVTTSSSSTLGSSQTQRRPAAPAQRASQSSSHSSSHSSGQSMNHRESSSLVEGQREQSKVTARRYVDIADPIESENEGAQDDDAAFRSPPRTMDGRADRSLHPLDEEVRHLKRMIEEMKSAQDSQEFTGSGAQALMSSHQQGALGTPALQSAFEQLVINGLDKRYAYALMRTVSFEIGPERASSPDEVLDQLATEIMKTTRVVSPLEGAGPKAGVEGERKRGPVVLALVGPTGVGKTTTVAKLASDAILKRNLRVGLINLDSYKIAAFDQLGTYAKILNVPFRSVGTAEELRAAIQDFQSLDLVILDTTGRSQRDPASLKEMQDILAAVPGVQTQLVLSVTTRDTELYDTANRFAAFRPQGIIVCKLDEATSYGAIYNVAQRAQLPLLCFTTGQRVPEDIEDATRERVAALLLDL